MALFYFTIVATATFITVCSPFRYESSQLHDAMEDYLKDLETYLVNLSASPGDPLSEAELLKWRSLSTALKRRVRVTQDECKDLQRQLADEFISNSSHLRLLTTVRAATDRPAPATCEAGTTACDVRPLNQRLIDQVHSLQKITDQQEQTINSLKKQIQALKIKYSCPWLHDVK